VWCGVDGGCSLQGRCLHVSTSGLQAASAASWFSSRLRFSRCSFRSWRPHARQAEHVRCQAFCDESRAANAEVEDLRMTLQKQEAQIEEVRVINSDPPPHLYSLPFPYIRSCGLVYPACVCTLRYASVLTAQA
jgi:hypothetical protein